MLCIEDETKIGLTHRGLKLEKRTMLGDVGNVPLSAVVTVSGDASLMVPTAPRTKHRHLLEPLVIYKTLYSRSSLVSIQLFFWMNTAPVSSKLSFLREEWCPVSTNVTCLSLPVFSACRTSHLSSAGYSGLMLPEHSEVGSHQAEGR